MDHASHQFVREAIELAIRETLSKCDLAYVHQLEAIRKTLHQIIMTQQELVTALNGLTTQVGVITTGINTLVANSTQVPTDVVTAVGNLTTAVNAAQAALPSTGTVAASPANG